MSWINELSRVYDQSGDFVGKRDSDDDNTVLLPLFHLTIQAQIQVMLSEDGEFIDAERIEKEYSTTIIPVTEDSATRSSGISPMPLCDKLKYLAGDFDERIPQLIADEKIKGKVDKKNGKKDSSAYHQAYMQQLKQWAEFPEVPQDIVSIYRYLQKGSLIRDLEKKGVLESEDDVVRFFVYTNDDADKGVWEKQDLFRSFIAFYKQQRQDMGLCYSTGKQGAIAAKFPAKLRNTGDKAKLVSSNDKEGFTFRGRFENAADAVAIGYETSEKAHNALRWLVAKQGYRNESEIIVTWCSPNEAGHLDTGINIMEGSEYLFRQKTASYDTGELFAQRLNSAIAGYQKDLSASAKIMTMAMDTADGSLQGRLAITFYSELLSSDFYRNIQKWYLGLSWVRCFYSKEEKKCKKRGEAPGLKGLVAAAYGIEQDGIVKVNEKQRKKEVNRLLPCIIQGKRFPKDMMWAAVRNIGEPQRFTNRNWTWHLFITCAMIKKVHSEEGREEKMALDKERNDRSYLFGRLLAVADQIESYVYCKEKYMGKVVDEGKEREGKIKQEDHDRETNAKKYWSAFVKMPAKTWSVLEEKIKPYQRSCKKYGRDFEPDIREIVTLFNEKQKFDNIPLREDYILGYYNQIASYRTGKNEEE